MYKHKACTMSMKLACWKFLTLHFHRKWHYTKLMFFHMNYYTWCDQETSHYLSFGQSSLIGGIESKMHILINCNVWAIRNSLLRTSTAKIDHMTIFCFYFFRSQTLFWKSIFLGIIPYQHCEHFIIHPFLLIQVWHFKNQISKDITGLC